MVEFHYRRFHSPPQGVETGAHEWVLYLKWANRARFAGHIQPWGRPGISRTGLKQLALSVAEGPVLDERPSASGALKRPADTQNLLKTGCFGAFLTCFVISSDDLDHR
jgi:hypothetical protein